MSDEQGILKVSIENKVCLLTLNRPERRNAMSRQMIAEISNAILDADVNPQVSLIAITGAGPAFCSGADLKDARSMDTSGKRFRGPLHRPERTNFEVLIESRKPILGIVNGPATGGGFELALACDMRVAADTAWFCAPEARCGMGAHFASVVLPHMVPMGIAMEWLQLLSALRLDVGPDPYASEDRKEGARAFLEKCAPVWQGR